MKSFKVNYLPIFKLEGDFLKSEHTKSVKSLQFQEQTRFVLVEMSTEFKVYKYQMFYYFGYLRIPLILKFKNKTQNLSVEFNQDGLRKDVEIIF